MKQRRLVSAVSLAAILAFGLFSRASAQTAKADLRNAQGETVGSATLTRERDGITISVRVSKVSPGVHGFHIHAVGKCEPPFTSAGGHFNPTNQSHPNHAGDLPVLLAKADGNASLSFKTDRFKLADLFDADGSAFIIHAGPDNYANIPARYKPAPDKVTLGTGDAGGRAACGVIMK